MWPRTLSHAKVQVCQLRMYNSYAKTHRDAALWTFCDVLLVRGCLDRSPDLPEKAIEPEPSRAQD